MISAEQLNGMYLIKFKGKKQQFTEYINKVMKLPDKQWNFKEKCWMIPVSNLSCLHASFKEIEFLDEVQDLQAKNVTGFDDMGKHMKLSPYAYQKEAIKFAIDTGSCLLVYPCGSGKTPIGIGSFMESQERGLIKGPGLVVVKASLKTQWLKEIQKFSDYNPVIIQTEADITASIKDKIKRRKDTLKKGTYRSKALTKEQISFFKKEIELLEKEVETAVSNQFDGHDLFILNYETLKEDSIRKELRKRNIEFIFADEIHYVKNKDSDRAKALYEFGDVKMRIGATATPIKKDYQDVYGIYKFIQPALFPSFNAFATKYIKYAGYGKISAFKNVEHLQKKIAPYMIVKEKQEISDQLPSLMTFQRYCKMYPHQQAASDDMMAELDELNEMIFNIRRQCVTKAQVEGNEELMKLEAKTMALQTFAQEVADSPLLMTKSDSKMSKEYAERYGFNTTKKSTSSKLELMAELVEEIVNSGEKVCIFSRYERMHDILSERILKIDKNIGIAKVNGTMNDKQRYSEIYDKFRDNDHYKVLLGTDAMAEGANLSKCRYLIEYDLAESYAIQTQRWGRLERADSIHDNVTVYQLICEDSWDEIQQKIVSKKEGFDAQLIKSLANRED